MLRLFVAIALLGLVSGCQQTIPKEALALSQVSIEKRNLQTRYFDTNDERLLLTASVGVLQDLGFTLEESETDLGVLLGTKDRDATEAGQVVAAVIIAALTGAVTHVDDKQKIRISVITRPIGADGTQTAVRTTFQRVVWNTQGQVSRTESLDDPQLYQAFFEKLSQSVFLDAHEI